MKELDGNLSFGNIKPQTHQPTNSSHTAVTCKVLRETEKALLIVPEYLDTYENLENEGVWIPLSQVVSIHPDHVVMHKWIAEQKGLL